MSVCSSPLLKRQADIVVYIGLGTNLGNRLLNLKTAIAAVAPQVEVKKQSSVYETEPWGYCDQPFFLNQVIEATTGLAPLDLLAHLKQIETRLGRTKTFLLGPRLIDLDILLFGDQVIALPALIIPHPSMLQRAFVLVPLAEVAPEVVHPVIGKTIADAAQAIEKKGVHLYHQEDK